MLLASQEQARSQCNSSGQSSQERIVQPPIGIRAKSGLVMKGMTRASVDRRSNCLKITTPIAEARAEKKDVRTVHMKCLGQRAQWDLMKPMLRVLKPAVVLSFSVLSGRHRIVSHQIDAISLFGRRS